MAYCTATAVKRWLPKSVTVEGLVPSPPNVRHPGPVSITDSAIEGYIALADADINSRIAAVYDVPLRKTNIGGAVEYPDPIPLISARYAAMLIWQERASGDDRQDTEWVRDNFDRAMNELMAISVGHQRLLGQDSLRSSRFAKSDWYNIAPFPTKNLPERSGR